MLKKLLILLAALLLPAAALAEEIAVQWKAGSVVSLNRRSSVR